MNAKAKSVRPAPRCPCGACGSHSLCPLQPIPAELANVAL